MAPLKFEEKIKEKLEQRAIEPTVGSWKRLEAQLDKQPHARKGYKTIWYSIAAVFVGIMILAFMFRGQNSVSGNKDTQFVDVTNEIQEKDNLEIVLENDTQEQEVKEKHQDRLVDKTKKDIILRSNTKKDIVVHNNDPISEDDTSKNQINTSIAAKVKDTFKFSPPKQEIAKTIVKEGELPISADIVEDKVASVVAQIQELKNNNEEVTEEEIDVLLRNAQREITSQEIFKSNTVNASALLQEVENEVDETFKQRVFEALKTSFQKVKTAVAEREN
ncbi:hypothetical protein [Aquimarina sp. AU474]|uniref:hypothetical protein n=1 Tax=Aquimarina sp. AU474 TaxID=2108529 RepID=UPI000D697AED|nr:hypothetical protein [Aquimarina sp. AU474]